MKNLLEQAGYKIVESHWRKPIDSRGSFALADWEQELNRKGGRDYGDAFDTNTRAILRQELEQAEFLLEDAGEKWRADWVTAARQALAKGGV